MDTFAALALASIPPSETVMNEPPRKSEDFIITRGMWANILGVGVCFLALLLGMLMAFGEMQGGITVRRLTIFFTTFVMLQFWNLFNARAFGGIESALTHLSKSYGLEIVAVVILVGQFLIVQFGGRMFRSVPLSWQEWGVIIAVTSLVLWVPETVRIIRSKK